MTRQRKNAGQLKPYGFLFHGAFGKKADAMEKRDSVEGGFIKPTEYPDGTRYVVMSPRKNPPRRRRKPPTPTLRNPRMHFVAEGKGRCKYCAKKRSLFALAGHPQAWQIGLGCRNCLKKRASGHNPAELLIMGANPPQRPARVTRGLVPRGTTRPGRRRKGVPRITSNPSAEDLRETFVGAPSEWVTVTTEPHIPQGDYAQLGELLALYVKPAAGGPVQEISFPAGERPDLVCAESARQMYFVGGGQDVSDALDLFGAQDGAGDGMYLLGECRRIDYKQRKEHVPDPEIDQWKHNFGEEDGVLPKLWFDAQAKRLLLQGGNYRIEASGINN